MLWPDVSLKFILFCMNYSRKPSTVESLGFNLKGFLFPRACFSSICPFFRSIDDRTDQERRRTKREAILGWQIQDASVSHWEILFSGSTIAITRARVSFGFQIALMYCVRSALLIVIHCLKSYRMQILNSNASRNEHFLQSIGRIVVDAP
jgi:hypothetical protein